MQTFIIIEDRKTDKPPEGEIAHKDDFSHIKGDIEDFIFSFSECKNHSEK